MIGGSAMRGIDTDGSERPRASHTCPPSTCTCVPLARYHLVSNVGCGAVSCMQLAWGCVGVRSGAAVSCRERGVSAGRRVAIRELCASRACGDGVGEWHVPRGDVRHRWPRASLDKL
eukprot:495037-Prymnesium_polylepis.2